MRFTRLCLTASLAMLISSLARSDEKTDPKDFASKIVGVWEVIDSELTKSGAKTTLEFTKDGKVKRSFEISGQKSMTSEGIYKIDGDKLTLTRLENGKEVKEDTETIAIKTLSDDKIVLAGKGKDIELNRKRLAVKEPEKKAPPK